MTVYIVQSGKTGMIVCANKSKESAEVFAEKFKRDYTKRFPDVKVPKVSILPIYVYD